MSGCLFLNFDPELFLEILPRTIEQPAKIVQKPAI
jgi:hypothetical protein